MEKQKVRWNPEINLGHVLQAVFLGFAIIGGFVAMKVDTNNTRTTLMFHERADFKDHARFEQRMEQLQVSQELLIKTVTRLDAVLGNKP